MDPNSTQIVRLKPAPEDIPVTRRTISIGFTIIWFIWLQDLTNYKENNMNIYEQKLVVCSWSWLCVVEAGSVLSKLVVCCRSWLCIVKAAYVEKSVAELRSQDRS